jgi:hypothetical protein
VLHICMRRVIIIFGFLWLTKEDRKVACGDRVSSLCRKYYGRGHKGLNIISNTWQVCDRVREKLQRAANAGR